MRRLVSRACFSFTNFTTTEPLMVVEVLGETGIRVTQPARTDFVMNTIRNPTMRRRKLAVIAKLRLPEAGALWGLLQELVLGRRPSYDRSSPLPGSRVIQ